MNDLRSLFDLSTEEAYLLLRAIHPGDLPPQDAIENEDWGRDYILQHLLQLPGETLMSLGLSPTPSPSVSENCPPS